jgi:dipeptidase
MLFWSWITTTTLLGLLLLRSDACTTLVVGRKATADGSVMAAHSADGGGNTDPRLVRIPGNVYDLSKSPTRAVFASPESYPRYVGVDPRAPAGDIPEYLPENCKGNKETCSAWEPIGFIPQVERTFAYYEAVYGVMNEHQVGIAESTCSAVFSAQSVDVGGKSLLSINALSQIAMERARTAKQAVSIMGELAEKYGFYGASDSFEGGAENLIVTDPHEAWVFHVLAGPTVADNSKLTLLGLEAKNNAGAIWVAARVPDGHMAVVANMFSVREIDLSDTDNFLGTTNMWDIAAEHGFWSKGDPMDFTKTFSDGEYAHKYYSGRRMWGAFRLLAADTKLPAEYDNLKEDAPYPFSIPVSGDAVKEHRGVLAADVFDVMRDFYNGTRYSLSAPSTGGGPFGTIDRFGNENPNSEIKVTGNWERSIAMYRTAESYVVQSGGSVMGNGGSSDNNNDTTTTTDDATAIGGGVVHFGAQSSSYTVYVPVISGGILPVPPSLSVGWQGDYDLSTNFWAARTLAFAAQVKWTYIIEDIREMQHALEAKSADLVRTLFSSTPDNNNSASAAAQLVISNCELAVKESMNLFHRLIFKYADGFINSWSKDTGNFVSSTPGYDGYWLQSTDYSRGPPPP